MVKLVLTLKSNISILKILDSPPPNKTHILYLKLYRACLGGVEGIEEVMGIRAGICEVEGKSGEVGVGELRRGQRQQGWGQRRGERRWAETHLLSPWSLGGKLVLVKG